MKSITILLFMLPFYLNSQVDCIRIDQFDASPVRPTGIDSVFIVLDITVCTLGELIERSLEIEDDSIFLEECYFSGLIDYPAYFNHKIPLGILDTGQYTIAYKVKITDSMDICYPYDSGIFYKNFQVRKYSSSNSIVSNPEVLIYPNPSHSGKFTLELKEPVEKIEIRNLTGKLSKELLGPFEVNQEIKLENIPPGLYFLEITRKNKPRYLVKLLSL